VPHPGWGLVPFALLVVQMKKQPTIIDKDSGKRRGAGRLARIIPGLLLFLLWFAPVLAGTDRQLDVRVLIDVSGSMKKNDPQNLRQPALRLLAGLLPDGIMAGVWIFDRDVTAIAPLQLVDDAWRQRAIQASQNIHSLGQFTHIEGGLQVAVGDWYQPDPNKDRHLILLTDGMVDVSQNPADSLASRERIFGDILGDLKAAGAKVHSIALSQRADLKLLQILSRETSGLNEAINNADRMQRVFMRLFQQAGKPDTLPLKDNRFQVDAGIREATVILFTGQRGDETRLIDPAHREFSARALPNNIRWHSDQGYELITIKTPEPGEWQLVADMDPDNRVMVVTDLKMHLNELPVICLAEQRPEIRVHFSSKGEKLTDADFVKIVTVSGEIIGGSQVNSFQLKPAETPGDFVLAAPLPDQAGRYQLVITGQGGTFSREARHQFEVRPALSLSRQDEAEQARVYLEIAPETLSDVRIRAQLQTAQGELPQIVLPVQLNRYEVDVSTLGFSGEASLQLRVEGSHRGAPVVLQPEPLIIIGTQTQLPPVTPEVPSPTPVEPVAPQPPAAEPEAEAEPEKAPAAEEEPAEGMGLIGWLVFAGVNLLLLGGGGLGWLIWRKRKLARELSELDDEDGLDDEQNLAEGEVEDDATS
jgi:uncharacterized protein (TIGR03503 family)